MSTSTEKKPAAASPGEKMPGPWSKNLHLQLPGAQVWELMWRPEGQQEWLGKGSQIQLQGGTRWALYDEAGPWRYARPIKIKTPTRITMEIAHAASWQGDGQTTVSISVCDKPQGGCIVTIEETNAPPQHHGEVEKYWSQRLDLLRALVGKVKRRRKSLRQALVVIHGIGEQQPGDTLASLLSSGVLTSATKSRVWMKPDRVSGSYELRRATLEATGQRPRTDVFEFYWGHIIRDTTLGQVATWLRRLMLRWRVPPPLRPVWLLGWIVALSAGAAWGSWALGAEWPRQWFASGTLFGLAAVAMWRFVGRGLATDLVGDAARYLMPHPANVAHRQAIRQAGVDLIKRLHRSGRYDRIILLGHSLGSVIAYDIITHSWAEMNANHRNPTAPSFKAIVDVERNINIKDIDRAQEIQHDAWYQARANTQPWLVTDLVTAGSPLAHAEFLMADSPGEFEKLKEDRTLPTCPPQPELERKSDHLRFTYDQSYRDDADGRVRTFTKFHHGAPFAVTRWTNLYFQTRRLGTTGDLIGGPVAKHFGQWVRDVKLQSPTSWVAHTWYWRKTEQSNAHLDALRKALNLNVRDELCNRLAEIPAFALLDDPGMSPENESE